MKKLLLILLPVSIVVAMLVILVSVRSPAIGPPPTLPADARLDPGVAETVAEAVAAVEDAPADASRRGRLGMVLHAHGMLDEADLAYRQAQSLDASEPRWPYHRARIAELAGRTDEAVAHFEEVLRIESGSAPALTRLGSLQLDLGEVNAARGRFERALAARPGDPAALVGLARADLLAGEPAEAARRLEALLETFPGTPYFHLLLGRAYRQLGRTEDADRQLAQASAGTPDFEDPWTAEVDALQAGFGARLEEAARLIARGRADAAIPILTALRETDPADVNVLNSLAAAYAATGRDEESRRLLEVAVLRDPNRVELRVNLSQAHERAGRTDDAFEEARAALELDPASGPAWLQLGRLHVVQRQYEQAADALARAGEYGAGSRGDRIMTGQVLLTLGRWDEAREVFEPLTERHPDFAPAWAGLAMAEMEQGRLDVAARHVRTARSVAPDDPTVRAAAARLQALRSGG